MEPGTLTDAILTAANSTPEHFESGEGHGQKGVDFQRYWAIARLFELESSNASDYLLLFEAIQDIAEMNSEQSPSSMRVYQVKKKDRGEWSWSALRTAARQSKEQ